MRNIITLLLVLCSMASIAQTVTTPPSGSKPYGTPVETPDGEILVGRNGSYTYITRKAYTDSLIALGYTKVQVDSAIAAEIANITFPVTSVNSKTGAVVIDAADIGLGNVDNTSDMDKPVSTATQEALDLKEDKTNKVTSLSTPNNTTYPTTQAVKNAIDGAIPDVSQFVNKWETWGGDFNLSANNMFWFQRSVDNVNAARIYMTGESFPQILNIENATGSAQIHLKVNQGGGLYNTVEFSNSGLVSTVPITAPNLNVFTRSVNGLVPAPGGSGTTRFMREDGTWAVPSGGGGGGTATDLSIQNRNASTLQIGSSTGANATVPSATTALSGLMTAADKTKLNELTGDYLPLSGGTVSGLITSSFGRTLADLGNTLTSQYHWQNSSDNTSDWFGLSVRAQAVGGTHTHASALGFIGTTVNNSSGGNGMDFAIYKRTGDGNTQIFRVGSNGTIYSQNHGNSSDWYSPTWSRVDGKPTTFTPSPHTHNASDINAGVLADARIPNLNASKINAGTFSIARIPTGTTGTTVALGNHTHPASAITSGTLNAARIANGSITNAKLATQPSRTVKGVYGGDSTPQNLTMTQLKDMLGITHGDRTITTPLNMPVGATVEQAYALANLSGNEIITVSPRAANWIAGLIIQARPITGNMVVSITNNSATALGAERVITFNFMIFDPDGMD